MKPRRARPSPLTGPRSKRVGVERPGGLVDGSGEQRDDLRGGGSLGGCLWASTRSPKR